MSCFKTARAFALQKADELEAKARQLGILRSVDATEASRWLKYMATSIREACEPPQYEPTEEDAMNDAAVHREEADGDEEPDHG